MPAQRTLLEHVFTAGWFVFAISTLCVDAGCSLRSLDALTEGGSSSGTTGSGGSSGTGGGSNASGGDAATHCGTNGTNTLRDDFEDGVVANEWGTYASDGMSLAEENGRAVFEIGPSVRPNFATFLSTAAYDLTDCDFAVRVPVIAVDQMRGYASAALTVADTSYNLQMIVADGQFRAVYTHDDGPQIVGEEPYDPDVHVWWRLREEDGTTSWEVSDDGASFRTIARLSNPLPVTSMWIGLAAGSEPTDTELGRVEFDDVNLPP